MIKITDYKKWLIDEGDEYSMIAIGYNPSIKDNVILNKFGLENPILDIENFSKIISNAIYIYIGRNFIAQLLDNKFSWLPNFVNSSNDKNVIAYLEKIKWNLKKYYGEYRIEDIKEYFTIFSDYPMKYNYQDIILSSIEKDVIIQISHHGTIWITSSDPNLLDSIYKYLDSEGATVIKGGYSG